VLAVPAKNVHHDTVIHALIADGWTITDDPLTLAFGGKDLYVDLGAERATIAAEKDSIRIAVEIQSFLSPSPVRDLEEAVGQYDVYRCIMTEIEPERALYLAVPEHVYESVFTDRLGALIVSRLELRLLVFDAQQRRISRWIP
jgi:hypothetical protein